MMYFLLFDSIGPKSLVPLGIDGFCTISNFFWTKLNNPVILHAQISNQMAVTRLERKGRKNKAKASKRNQSIKLLNRKPVIKNVDIEEIKAEFSKLGDSKKAEPKAEKKEPVKKAAAKKEEAPKAESDVNVTGAETKEEEAPKPTAKKEENKEEAPKAKAEDKKAKEEKEEKPKAKKSEKSNEG